MASKTRAQIYAYIADASASISRSFVKLAKVIFGETLGYGLQVVPFIIFLEIAISNLVYFTTKHNFYTKQNTAFSGVSNATETFDHTETGVESILELLYLKNLSYFMVGTTLIIGLIYWGCGAIFYYLYDVRQKDSSEWKLQPNKTASPDKGWILDVAHNIIGIAMFAGVTFCYAYNGGPRVKIYFRISDSPLWWAVLQYPAIILYMDYIAYWQHRLQHTPFMYKRFHKVHHKYTPQRMLIALAGHPVDIVVAVIDMYAILLMVPLHWSAVLFATLNLMHNNLLDHSGIDIPTPKYEPWRRETLYHDLHHRFPNNNFGVLSSTFDYMFGTNKTDFVQPPKIQKSRSPLALKKKIHQSSGKNKYT